MAGRDLVAFIAELERRYPERLARVKEPIDPGRFEVTGLLHQMQGHGMERTVLFERPQNLLGKPSDFPLLFNAFVTRAHCAIALGLPPEEAMGVSLEFARRERRPGRVEVVAEAVAPCKEVVRTGEEADVRILPVPMHHADDVGPYFTMTVVMKALSGNFYDVSFTKNMVQGPRRLSLSAHAHHHHDTIVGEYEKAGRRAPVAIILGHHPAFFLASCALTPYGTNDYELIAGFGDSPLRLAPSATWGEAFLVPADAEIIIEGEVPPGVRDFQNPFGEIAGYYQERIEMPVVEVTAITHRTRGIMQGIFPGHPEHWNLGGIPKEGSIYNVIKRTIPGLRAVHLPPSGCGRFSCYISLKKEFENEPRKAAMAAFVEMPNLKYVVVVDEDVDVFSERDVQWALVTRTWWDRDLQIIDKVQSFRGWLGGTVAIVDATRPTDRPFPKTNSLPADVLARMRPEKYLS